MPTTRRSRRSTRKPGGSRDVRCRREPDGPRGREGRRLGREQRDLSQRLRAPDRHPRRSRHRCSTCQPATHSAFRSYIDRGNECSAADRRRRQRRLADRAPSGGLWRIDPRTNTVQMRLTGLSPRSLASAAQGVWLANPDSTVVAVTARGRPSAASPSQRRPHSTTSRTGTGLSGPSTGRTGRYGASIRGQGPSHARFRWALEHRASPTEKARCGWRTGSTERSCASIPPPTASSRRSQSAAYRGRSPPATASSGSRSAGRVLLRASACGPVLSGVKAKPDYLITSDFPLQMSGASTPPCCRRQSSSSCVSTDFGRAATASATSPATTRSPRPAAWIRTNARRIRARSQTTRGSSA